MGLPIEFNLILALRNIEEYKSGRKKQEECIPEKLEKHQTYDFLKSDQRVYFMDREIALVETKGSEQLSRPLASIVMEEVTHIMQDGKVWTKGKYNVVDVFDPKDTTVYFEVCQRRK